MGARIVLDEMCKRDGVTPAQAWLSESQARVLVAVPRTEEQLFADMCRARWVPAARIGMTDDSGAIEVQGQFTLGLDEARKVWEAPLPERFG
jgi:phosphoribosylformylglycinamidine (FGAM) synthase-like enzyme